MLRRHELLLWTGGLIAAAASLAAFDAGRPLPMEPPRGVPAPAPRAVIPSDSLGTRVLRVVAADPFRFDRVPARVPYGTLASGAPAPAAITVVPALRLSGIIGPPWRAVIDGASLESGRLVAAGDSVAGALVRDVRRSGVTLRLADTTWIITLDRP